MQHSQSQQVWLRTQSPRPLKFVLGSLTDTSAYTKWWGGQACTIESASGDSEPGEWFQVTSCDGNGRRRRFGGQLLEKTECSLTFSWRGELATAVRVVIELNEADDGTRIDVRISGVGTKLDARRLRREWKQILRAIG